MKLALVRLSSLGDIVLAMAVLQEIKRAIPHSRITWVTEQRFAPLFEHQPDLERVIAVDLKGLKAKPRWSDLVALRRKLQSSGPYERVIDLHGMIKSAVLGSQLGGLQSGFDRSCRKEALAGVWYQDSYRVPYQQPAMARYLQLAGQSLGFVPSLQSLAPPEPYLFWSVQEQSSIAPFLTADRKNILFVPCTSAANKNYPPEQFAQLAKLLDGVNVLVCHGSDHEYQAAATIASLVPGVSVLPRLSLGELKALAGSVDLVVGGDSGPTHLALACGVPSITLFGATPVCFQPTTRNRAIKTATVPNLLKPDPRDCSVAEIPPLVIAEQVWDLLGRCV